MLGCDHVEPIDKVLNRIRWDREFGAADFVIGYYDRVEDDILQVPLEEIERTDSRQGTMELIDDQGVRHTIPLHRIREVYRDGVLIWHRPANETSVD